MTLYSVTNWNRLFENHRTRELKRLEWVPVPNKHDGDGFTDLISRKNGVALYGAWMLILQVASKCDPRGVLSRDGAEERGEVPRPHSAASLARMTRCPEDVMAAAIKACLEIGWLEAKEVPINDLREGAPGRGKAPEAPRNPALGHDEVPMEGKGMEEEGNGMEQNTGDEAPAVLSDEDWLKSLQADEAYKGLDVPHHAAKAKRWCLEHNRKFTRRFFINWLNRQDKPLTDDLFGGQEDKHANGF